MATTLGSKMDDSIWFLKDPPGTKQYKLDYEFSTKTTTTTSWIPVLGPNFKPIKEPGSTIPKRKVTDEKLKEIVLVASGNKRAIITMTEELWEEIEHLLPDLEDEDDV